MRFGLKRTAAPHVASVPRARDAGRAFGENLTAAQCSMGDEVVIKVAEATLLGGSVLINGLPLMTGLSCLCCRQPGAICGLRLPSRPECYLALLSFGLRLCGQAVCYQGCLHLA